MLDFAAHITKEVNVVNGVPFFFHFFINIALSLIYLEFTLPVFSHKQKHAHQNIDTYMVSQKRHPNCTLYLPSAHIFLQVSPFLSYNNYQA